MGYSEYMGAIHMLPEDQQSQFRTKDRKVNEASEAEARFEAAMARARGPGPGEVWRHYVVNGEPIKVAVRVLGLSGAERQREVDRVAIAEVEWCCGQKFGPGKLKHIKESQYRWISE